jgi:hypothetical protein
MELAERMPSLAARPPPPLGRLVGGHDAHLKTVVTVSPIFHGRRSSTIWLLHKTTSKQKLLVCFMGKAILEARTFSLPDCEEGRMTFLEAYC